MVSKQPIFRINTINKSAFSHNNLQGKKTAV